MDFYGFLETLQIFGGVVAEFEGDFLKITIDVDEDKNPEYLIRFLNEFYPEGISVFKNGENVEGMDYEWAKCTIVLNFA